MGRAQSDTYISLFNKSDNVNLDKTFDRKLVFVHVLKARCTPEKLTILTKHSKTFFFNHVVKNIVNYQLQKLYLKWTSIKVQTTLLRHGVTVR